MGWDCPRSGAEEGHWPIDSPSDDGEVRAVQQAMVVGTGLKWAVDEESSLMAMFLTKIDRTYIRALVGWQQPGTSREREEKGGVRHRNGAMTAGMAWMKGSRKSLPCRILSLFLM